jgi:hypothetical protein
LRESGDVGQLRERCSFRIRLLPSRLNIFHALVQHLDGFVEGLLLERLCLGFGEPANARPPVQLEKIDANSRKILTCVVRELHSDCCLINVLSKGSSNL